jgi:hypothetical protein
MTSQQKSLGNVEALPRPARNQLSPIPVANRIIAKAKPESQL